MSHETTVAYYHRIRARSLIFPTPDHSTYKSIMRKKGWQDRPVDTMRLSVKSDWNAERLRMASALKALAFIHRDGGLLPEYVLSYSDDNLVLQTLDGIGSCFSTTDAWRTPTFFRKKS